MSFFDTKLMGDLMQRMNDHNRIEKFLTTQMLNVTFSLLSFVVFGCVLFSYNLTIFCIFLLASVLYALWIALFLGKEKFWIMNYSKNRQKTATRPTNSSLPCRRLSCKTASNAGDGNGKMYRRICSACK